MHLPEGDINSPSGYTLPSFHNAYTLNQKLEQLPHAGEWFPCELNLGVIDDDGEPIILYFRNPIDCIRQLFGKPQFKDQMVYAPQKEFRDETESNRLYGEMWTAQWWWDIQRCLPAGATLIPVILASGKTNLTVLSGSKQAYPVYVTIGNIPSNLRRQESARSWVVLAYLPVPKLAGYSKTQRRVLFRELFHQSMGIVLEPLQSAGQTGIEMTGADGWIRNTYPTYAAHLADYQEQVQIACMKGCRCPMCQAPPELLGVLQNHPPRTTLETAQAIRLGTDFNLNSVTIPYWERLPFVRLHTLFPPDVLHQLLKGMFKDHVFGWCLVVISDDGELDRRFRCLPQFPGLKHFRNGVTRISQWTGNEFRAMVRVVMGVLAQAPNMTSRALTMVRAFLDFLFACAYDYHDNASLQGMESNLQRFHELKDEFVQNGGQKVGMLAPEIEGDEDDLPETAPENSWMIPKMHMMSHYLELSKALGAPSHFSTDQTEHLHIRSTEIPYRKANKRHYAKQIVRRLEMSEQIAERNEYFKWRQDHQFRKDLARVVYSDSESEHRGSDGAAEDNGQAEEEDPGTEGEISDEEEYDDKPEATHLFPKQPAYLNFHIARASRTFGTSDLYRQLQLYYLRASGGAAARRRVVGYELDPLPFVTVSLYKQLRVSVEAPPYNPRLKIVLTVKADPYGGEKIRGEVKPYHSVVLINEKWPEQTGGGIKRYRCAIVRAILRIPDPTGIGEQAVAYVEWFTRFGAQPHESTGMYRVKKSYQSGGGGREGSIVDATAIRRPCHAIPEFGAKTAEDWRS